MVSCQVVMDALERIAPKRLAEDWDNPGLLVGAPDQDVRRILVCLDVSDSVVECAIRSGADMIVAHHPLIFKGLKKIRTDLPLGRRLQQLLKNDIAVAAAHTNLDIAVGGVNDVLATAIGLSKLSTFVIASQSPDGTVESMGRMGRLPAPMTVHDFAQQVRKNLKKEGVYKGFKAVFSTEAPLKDSLIYTDGSNYKKSAYGTMSYLPATFGAVCASVVIRDLIEAEK